MHEKAKIQKRTVINLTIQKKKEKKEVGSGVLEASKSIHACTNDP